MSRSGAIQIRCPQCGGRNTHVVCTFHTEAEQLVRRRHCQFCDHRWYTVQSAEQPLSKYRIKWKPDKRIVELTDEI
jgi:transcriptional regulator NrdR family protein